MSRLFCLSEKMREEEIVEDLILRVYNKNANVYIKIGLEDFILKIVDDLEKMQGTLYQLKNSDDVVQFSKPITEDQIRD